MQGTAERWVDEVPPESGVRRIARRPAPSVARPAETAPHTASAAPPLAPHTASAAPPLAPDAEVLREVGEQVFLEVWDLMLALQPLQGPWLRVGLGHMGTIALRVLGWEIEERREEGATDRRGVKTLRERWPELVPGYASMDRLVGLMVDWICR